MNEKLIWLDNVRAIACVMVVVLHVSAIYVLKTDGFYWEIGNIVDSFTRICVPLFFMISGYLFFSVKQVQLKNFLRLLVPLVCYSFVGLAFSFLSFKFGFISKFNYNFIAEPLFYHLWYFYPLLVIYAISYFIQIRMVRFSIRSLILLILLLFVFCNPLVSDFFRIIFGISFKNYFFINGDFFYYLFYALLGALTKEINVTKRQALIFLIIYLVLSFLILIGTSWLHQILLYNYLNPMISFAAISFFIYLKNGFDKSNYFSDKALGVISKYSLGIYCIHAFVLLVVEKVFDIKSINPLFGIIFFSLIVLVVSIVISFLLRKIDRNGYIS